MCCFPPHPILWSPTSLILFSHMQNFGCKVAHDSPHFYEKLTLSHLTCYIFCIKDEQKQRDNSFTQRWEYEEIKTRE